MLLFARLPHEIILEILTYDKHFRVRSGQLAQRIPYDDARLAVLCTIPPIDRFGHAMLAAHETYELHVMVFVDETNVRWTWYRYYTLPEEDDFIEEIMDGVVFSMGRCSESTLV